MSIETWWHGGGSKTKTFYGKAFGKRNFEGVKNKRPRNYRAFYFQIGGGGGNRTRVREPFGRASTYIACILNSPLGTPTGRIPERLSY